MICRRLAAFAGGVFCFTSTSSSKTATDFPRPTTIHHKAKITHRALGSVRIQKKPNSRRYSGLGVALAGEEGRALAPVALEVNVAGRWRGRKAMSPKSPATSRGHSPMHGGIDQPK